jgi:flagellin
MQVAMRNTQNAVSMLQTADSLLDDVGNILSRMSDLAIMAADASTSYDDRASLNAEYVTLSEQVLKDVNESSYGGKYLIRAIVAPPGPNGPGTMASGPMKFQVGDSAAENVTVDFRQELAVLNGTLYFAIDKGNLFGHPVDAPFTALTWPDWANALLPNLAAASQEVLNLRSQIGALANRLDSAYRNLSSMVTNTENAHGRVMDVDFATESATMTTNQMLMQTGTAMVKNSVNAMQLVRSLIE